MENPPRLITHMLAESSSRPVSQRVVIAVERRVFLKRRWRAQAPDGSDFGFDLEHRLVDGCVVYQTEDVDYVVEQLPEIVYNIPFENPAHAAEVAWKVGNLHLPAEILEDRILVLHDEAMTQLLARENWQFSEPSVLFRPLKAMAHT